jgi:hypothetical protein
MGVQAISSWNSNISIVLACAEENCHLMIEVEVMLENCKVPQIGKPYDIEGNTQAL